MTNGLKCQLRGTVLPLSRPCGEGQALHLPAELLGDIYADPYAKKTQPADRDLPMAGAALSREDVAHLKGSVMTGWHGAGTRKYCPATSSTHILNPRSLS